MSRSYYCICGFASQPCEGFPGMKKDMGCNQMTKVAWNGHSSNYSVPVRNRDFQTGHPGPALPLTCSMVDRSHCSRVPALEHAAWSYFFRKYFGCARACVLPVEKQQNGGKGNYRFTLSNQFEHAPSDIRKHGVNAQTSINTRLSQVAASRLLENRMNTAGEREEDEAV